MQLSLTGAPGADIPTVNRAMLRAARELAVSEHVSPARIDVRDTSGGSILRVTVQADAVDIMGTFTDWQPVPLSKVDDTTWELRIPVASGLHRFNIRINGGEWLVPVGARLVETEFGGAVGVVVVP